MERVFNDENDVLLVIKVSNISKNISSADASQVEFLLDNVFMIETLSDFNFSIKEFVEGLNLVGPFSRRVEFVDYFCGQSSRRILKRALFYAFREYLPPRDSFCSGRRRRKRHFQYG